MASASCCREKRPTNGKRGGGKRTTDRLRKADAQCTPPSRDPTQANAGEHATQKLATPPSERARPKRVGSAQKRPPPRGTRRGCPSRASDAGWRAIRATRHPRRRPREGGARRGAGHAWATYDLGLRCSNRQSRFFSFQTHVTVGSTLLLYCTVLAYLPRSQGTVL